MSSPAFQTPPAPHRLMVAADRAAFERALCDHLECACWAGIGARGKASLVLAGGSTPLPAYRTFAGQRMPWAEITLIPSDERQVPVHHERSNQGALMQIFAEAAPRLTGLVDAAGVPISDVTPVRASMPYDLVVLGMGEDGHFASIFPGAHELAHLLSTTEDTLSPVTAPGASEPRVSLTLPALLTARRVVLAFAGPGKWATFEQVLGDGPDTVLPTRALLRQQQVPVDIVACL